MGKKNVPVKIKKRHTVKNQITVNNHGYILHKIHHKKGRKHDYDIYKKNYTVTPNELFCEFNLGYLGVTKEYETTIHLTI